MGSPKRPAQITCRALTPSRWGDLVKLFGPQGACWGCWCMFFRQTGAEFGRRHGAPNRRMLRRLVVSGAPTGLIAYAGREPVGWCSVAPRVHYSRLSRSPLVVEGAEPRVWSVVCFYIPSRHRRAGVTKHLLEAAVTHARRRGATSIEGYPVDPKGRRISELSAYHGLGSTFRSAGFREIARPRPERPVMRRELTRAKQRAVARAAAPRRARG